MKLIAPEYYKSFKCIASKCFHNCCVGWEIDIDSDTYEKYKKIDGDFGEKLRSSIDLENGEPHFRLADNERCPFLNNSGLCDIISNLGEEHLCNICSDHPRFRNFYSDRIEIGIGLCCEEAARIIISENSSSELVVIEYDGTDEIADEEDSAFLALRDKIFSIIRNQNQKLSHRINNICDMLNIKYGEALFNDATDLYLSLEHLSPRWPEIISKLRNFKEGISVLDSLYCDDVAEKLLVYFLYRQLPDSLYDGKFNERFMFSVLSTYIICALLYVIENSGAEDAVDIARMYSAEIEYSDENIMHIIDWIGDKIIM